jgi:HEAT repeat protein
MGPAGRAESVPVLAAAAAEGAEESRAVARKALRLVNGPGVDEAILGLVRSGSPAMRLEVIRALGDRGTTAGLPVLLTVAGEADAAIRTEAIRQVGALAGPKEWARLLDLIVSTANDSDRPALVAAAAAAAVRQRNPGTDLALRLQAAPPAPVHAALLSLAGRVASDTTLPDLVRAAASADAPVRDAALRALGAWPRSTALPALLDAAAGANPQAQRLALRGAVDVARKATDLDDAARIARYRDIATKLSHDDDRRMLLSAVGALSGPKALDVAAGFLGQPSVRAEAEAAAIQIAKRSGKPDAATAVVLQRIASESTSQTRKDEAAALLK